jgi:hypothetical protein
MVIKLYSGDYCQACKALKKRLVALELTNYTECDIGDYDMKTDLMALGLRSIPVLAIYNNNGVIMDTMVGNIASDAHLEEFFA